MILSKGDKYRLGVWIKEFGERLGHKKITARLASPVIKFGLALKESVFDCPVSELK